MKIGRKTWLFVTVELFASVMWVLSNMTAAEWAEFTKWFFAAYAAGNVGEHFSDGVKEKRKGISNLGYPT